MGLERSQEWRKQLNICRSPSIPFQAQLCWLYGLQIPAPSVCPTLQPDSSFSLLAEGLVEQMSQVSWDQLFPLLKVIWLTLTETGLEATTAAVGQQGCGRGSPHFSKGMITGSWGWLEAAASSANPGTPRKGAQTSGQSHWGSPVRTNYFTGNQSSADNHFWILWIWLIQARGQSWNSLSSITKALSQLIPFW